MFGDTLDGPCDVSNDTSDESDHSMNDLSNEIDDLGENGMLVSDRSNNKRSFTEMDCEFGNSNSVMNIDNSESENSELEVMEPPNKRRKLSENKENIAVTNEQSTDNVHRLIQKSAAIAECEYKYKYSSKYQW